MFFLMCFQFFDKKCPFYDKKQNLKAFDEIVNMKSMRLSVINKNHMGTRYSPVFVSGGMLTNLGLYSLHATV